MRADALLEASALFVLGGAMHTPLRIASSASRQVSLPSRLREGQGAGQRNVRFWEASFGTAMAESGWGAEWRLWLRKLVKVSEPLPLRPEPPRFSWRLLFVRRSIRFEQDPEQVFA